MNTLRGRASRWFAVALPHVEQPLSRVFREDRLLLWCTLALWVAGLIPLFFTPILPFSDLPNAAASAALMGDAALGRGQAAVFFRVNWIPTPYLTTYVVLAVLGGIVGPLIACKVVTAIILILIPLGMMRLLVTLRRSPRLALWSFLLGYNHLLFAGWVSFLVGIGLCLFVIAWTIEARTAGEALRVAPYSALVGLTHIQAVWLLMVAIPLLVPFGRPLRRRLVVHLISGCGLGLTVIPWLAARLATRRGTPVASIFSFDWHRADHKISQIFGYTLDNFTREAPTRWTAFAFVLLALGPLCLSLLPRRPTGDRNAAPLALVASSVALYAFLFMAISGPMIHWYTYPRYALVTLLFLLAVPTPRLDGRYALALLPGIITVLALDVEVGRQFKTYGQTTRPLLQIIAQVKPQAAVLPLVMDDDVQDPELKVTPNHQLTSYITAFRKGYMPSMWDYAAWPVVYRDEKRKPWPGWDFSAQMAFDMQKYGPHYDYVVVQGFERGDPLAPLKGAPGPHPQLLVEAGRWRLYQIVR